MNRVRISLCVDALGSLDGHIHERPDLTSRSEAVRHILGDRGRFTDTKLHPDAGETVPAGTTIELTEERYVATPQSTRGIESRGGVPKKDIDVMLPAVMVDGLRDLVEKRDDPHLDLSTLVEIHIREYLDREWPDGTPVVNEKMLEGDHV